MPNENYIALRKIIAEAVKANNDYDGWDIRESFDDQREEIEARETEVILEAIWPDFVGLLAANMEYEHALEHTADIETHKKYEQIYCEECARLAQSAIDGVNRPDFIALVNYDDAE